MPELSFPTPRHSSGGLQAEPAPELFVAVHDAAPRQVVRRKLHRNFISGQNADEILAHLSGNVREHLMLVFQLDPKHGVGQRLNHGGHHFNGVFLGIGRVGLALFRLGSLTHVPSRAPYQEGPCISRGRVNTQGPFEVTATVCSKCADFVPSAVTVVQSSSSTRTSGLPIFTMGSIARTIPSCRRGPRPGSP